MSADNAVIASQKPLTRVRAKASGSQITKRAVLYLVLVIAAIFLLLPFFWMVMSSFKLNTEVFTAPIKWLPEIWRPQNYLDLFNSDLYPRANLGAWMKNTIILSVVVTFLQVLTGSFAAYGFSRIKFPGRDALFLAYVATIAVPWQSYMISQFTLISDFDAGIRKLFSIPNTERVIMDSLWSMILLQAFGAFGVFLMKQFYETIPEELSEAARLDGLSEYGIWTRIMLPLSAPALASLALLTFVNTWNDYLGPRLYLRSSEVFTIQLGLRTFIDSYNADYAMIFAGSVISCLPIAIIFLIGQRYFIQGIATSGMKG
jgi:multiple sugar transport system permease protein